MAVNDRIILHCDCNSFFASVETALNPEYKNVPMAVCGSQDDRHGIVLAKNELAKQYGIQTAETVISAKKKCPSLVIAPPHHSKYLEYSKKVNQIYARYTDIIEPFGIDESWLDVTASQKLFGMGYEIAEKISNDVKKELNITVSIGVSFNKVFAKLGSDYKKPDAITEINRENFQSIVYPLPVSALLFVGKKTADALLTLGIKTIGELAVTTPQMLSERFGKVGEMLHKYAAGLDDSPVAASSEEQKSISNGFTFKHNLIGRGEWKLGVDYLCDEIGTRLRKNGFKCSTIQVAIKDEYLVTLQKQCSQNPPSNIGAEISSTALNLIESVWSPNKPIRMITVTATNLIHDGDYTSQVSFFDTSDDFEREKVKESEEVVDRIRERFGSASILKAAVIDTDIGIYDSNKRKEPSSTE